MNRPLKDFGYESSSISSIGEATNSLPLHSPDPPGFEPKHTSVILTSPLEAEVAPARRRSRHSCDKIQFEKECRSECDIAQFRQKSLQQYQRQKVADEKECLSEDEELGNRYQQFEREERNYAKAPPLRRQDSEESMLLKFLDWKEEKPDQARHYAEKQNSHFGAAQECFEESLDADAKLAALLQQEEDDKSNLLTVSRNDESDAQLAAKLQEEWNNSADQLELSQFEADRSKAEELQKAEEREAENSRIEEERGMRNSTTGKAILLVNQLLDAIQEVVFSYASFAGRIEAVSSDDMVFLAERLLETQRIMRQSSDEFVPWRVDIGYHYTNSFYLHRIRTDGLMSHTERRRNGIFSGCVNGAVFGDGVYTGNNPFSFHKYGDTGLIVARLKGRIYYHKQRSGHPDEALINGFNTVRANKKTHSSSLSHFWDEDILRSSSQCLPIVRYDASMIKTRIGSSDDNCGNCCVIELHERLQEVIDGFLNDGATTQVELPSHMIGAVPLNPEVHILRAVQEVQIAAVSSLPQMHVPIVQPSSVQERNGQERVRGRENMPHRHTLCIPTRVERTTSGNFGGAPHHSRDPGFVYQESIQEEAAPRRHASSGGSGSSPSETLTYSAPLSFDSSVEDFTYKKVTLGELASFGSTPCCDVCHSELLRNIVTIQCGHVFHRDCLLHALSTLPFCPVCQKTLAEPQGTSPSGKLTIEMMPTPCHLASAGFPRSMIRLSYSMQSGLQRIYHDNPGNPYASSSRTAYLPYNSDGLRLLSRLRYAFLHGLTFTVGRSKSTGRCNRIIWGPISHKTSLEGGAHGYPDPTYFQKCHRELDQLNVPPANRL